MKSIEKLNKKLEWLLKAIDDEENQSEIQQVKLWAQIDLLRWILEKEKWISILQNQKREF